MLLDVCIPAGVGAGDNLNIDTPSGDLVVVQIPKGFAAGDILSVECDVPANIEYDVATNEPLEVSVVIPEGVYEGDSFTCEMATGVLFDIIVPPGCGPGDAVFCQVPVGEGGGSLRGSRRPSTEDIGSSGSSSSSSDASLDHDASSDHKYRSGQQVMVLRTDGSFSKATIVSSFEGVFDVLYEVRLESGLSKPAVAESDMYDASMTPPTATIPTLAAI